jgi:hypothetical protein
MSEEGLQKIEERLDDLHNELVRFRAWEQLWLTDLAVEDERAALAQCRTDADRAAVQVELDRLLAERRECKALVRAVTKEIPDF